MLVNNQGKALVVNGNALVVDDSNIIYQLYNYTCDGTAATAINTGIYLFDTTLYPNGWDIYFDFTIGENNVGNASFLRCRNATSPYNGFTARRHNNSADQMQVQANSSSKNIKYSPLAGTRVLITIENPSAVGKYKVLINGGNAMEVANDSIVSPLVIGGELSNDTTQVWNPDRFAKITIHSLVITSK